jgi:glycosyltransferase involved in cell wall biosynthesis
MLKTKVAVTFFLHNLSNAGIERVVLYYLNTLSREKFKISVFLYDYNAKNSLEDNVPADVIIHKGSFKKKGVAKHYSIVKELGQFAKKQQTDIIYSVNPYTNILARVVTYNKKIVNLASHHNVNTQMLNRVKDSKKRVLLSFIYKKVFPRFDYNINVSNAIQTDLIDNFAVHPERSAVIYNGINATAISPLMNELFSDHIPDKFFLFVGRLEAQKSTSTLLKAFAALGEEYHDYSLLILGDGSLKEELKQQTIALGVTGRIQFLGFNPNPFKYMRKAKALILPSIFEGFGCVLIEAMYCGTAVIATNIEGPAEVIVHEENGLLFSVGDDKALKILLERVADDPELTKKLIANGEAFANGFIDVNSQFEDLCVGLTSK